MDDDLFGFSLSFTDKRPEDLYYLMHKDNVVAKSTDLDINDWEVLLPNLLPYGIRLYSSAMVTHAARAKRSLGSLAEKELQQWIDEMAHLKVKVLNLNAKAMQDWLSNRVLPLNRENSKLLYQALSLEQKESKQYKSEIAKRFRAISITDNYWLKKSTENILWSEVDVRRIPLHENLALFALTGDSDFTLDCVQDIQAAAETGLIGTYPKGCVRRNNTLYVVKGGSRRDVIAEWLSSMILGCTNVYGYCRYYLDDGMGHGILPCTGTYTTYCEVMSNQNKDLVMAVTIPEGKALEIALSKFPSQLAQIAVWDYLCGNTDRHSGNWGFFREAPSWDITGLHDIYDNNKSFGALTYKKNGRYLNGSIIGRGTENSKTLEQGALQCKDAAQLRFIKPIQREWFKHLGNDWEDCITEFQERCKVLEISVIITD